MNILKLLISLIFPVSSFIHIALSASCPTPSICGDLGFPIEYPFYLNNTPQQKPYNNYYCPHQSGFNLTCNPQSKLIINIPLSGNYYVNKISNPDRRIYLADPQDCLAKRLLATNFSLVGSPFLSPPYNGDYSLFSCPPDISKNGYSSIPCMSNSSVSVVVGGRYSSFLLNKCTVYLRLLEGSGVLYNQNYGALDEIVLTWPDHYYYSTCNGDETCADINPSTGSQAHTPVGVLIVIPIAVVGLLALTMTIACKYGRENTTNDVRQDLTATQPPPPTIVSSGMDDSMIELCSVKVIIGESFRELISSDYYSKLCAICLVDFIPKETIRCIDECQHYYHADCIDEWLKINGICPVCRTTLKK